MNQTFTSTGTSTLTVWFKGCAGDVAIVVVDASNYSGTVAGTGCTSTAWQAITVHGLAAGSTR